MPQLRYITPFLRVPDITTAVTFLTDTLGFQVSIKACARAGRRSDWVRIADAEAGLGDFSNVHQRRTSRSSAVAIAVQGMYL